VASWNRQNEEKEADMPRTIANPGPTHRRYEVERGFEIPLPMTVEGTDARGRKFCEETVLSYMSHKGASFPLRALIAAGARLRLAISLPPRLAEDKALKMIIHGQAILVESAPEPGEPPRVSIRLESRYLIEPEKDAPEAAGERAEEA
jgi:hypothetical protein